MAIVISKVGCPELCSSQGPAASLETLERPSSAEDCQAKQTKYTSPLKGSFL